MESILAISSMDMLGTNYPMRLLKRLAGATDIRGDLGLEVVPLDLPVYRVADLHEPLFSLDLNFDTVLVVSLRNLHRR